MSSFFQRCTRSGGHFMRVIYVQYWEEEVQQITVKTTHGLNTYSEFRTFPQRREMNEEWIKTNEKTRYDKKVH